MYFALSAFITIMLFLKLKKNIKRLIGHYAHLSHHGPNISRLNNISPAKVNHIP